MKKQKRTIVVHCCSCERDRQKEQFNVFVVGSHELDLPLLPASKGEPLEAEAKIEQATHV
jgi:hypothetical protein